MNQILINQKVYVTPKLKRKRRFYQFQFVLSIIAVIILISYAGYTEYTQRKSDNKSQELLNSFSNVTDATIADDDTIVVTLSENTSHIPQEQKVWEGFNTVYKTDKGTEYRIDSILNIPSLDIRYPVISESTTELLSVSLNKFWGGNANSVGNYCIVGHNYDGKDIFFGKLHKIQNGDEVEITDNTGKTLKYTVYDKYIVQPSDVACTSQLTNNRIEATLITCANGGRTRLIVKCRVVE